MTPRYSHFLLEDAESFVLGYTNRTKLIPPLEKPVRDLAVIALNRIGTEGENSRSEGGESYNLLIGAPKNTFYDVLKSLPPGSCKEGRNL